MNHMHVKTLDTIKVQGAFHGQRLGCIEGFNGFQVIRLEDDPKAAVYLPHDAQIRYRFVMEDDSLGQGIFTCLRARIYGIKDISELVIPEVPDLSPVHHPSPAY
jgi:hypothetical protein